MNTPATMTAQRLLQTATPNEAGVMLSMACQTLLIQPESGLTSLPYDQLRMLSSLTHILSGRLEAAALKAAVVL